MLIKITTPTGLSIIKGQGAKTALATARAWLKKSGVDMGGGREASIHVAVPGGRWHRLGLVGNPSDRF